MVRNPAPNTNFYPCPNKTQCRWVPLRLSPMPCLETEQAADITQTVNSRRSINSYLPLSPNGEQHSVRSGLIPGHNVIQLGGWGWISQQVRHKTTSLNQQTIDQVLWEKKRVRKEERSRKRKAGNKYACVHQKQFDFRRNHRAFAFEQPEIYLHDQITAAINISFHYQIIYKLFSKVLLQHERKTFPEPKEIKSPKPRNI